MIDELSESQQKIVSICSAFIGRPAVVLLDEPLKEMAQFERNNVIGAVAHLRSAGKFS